MKLKIPTKLEVWGAFWRLVGKLILNRTFAIMTMLVVTYLLGVGTSRIVLNACFNTGSAVVEKCNAGLETVGITYRLDMPNLQAPQAIPVGENLEYVDDPMLLPPLDNIAISDNQLPYNP
jgi:hypothetical protein